MNYHAHLYFSDVTFGRAEGLRAELTERFGEQVRLFPLHAKAVGPHPVPSFGVAFTSPIVDDIRAWLKALAPEISGLLHPITADDQEAHTEYAEWYGNEQALRFDRLGERPHPTRDGLSLTRDPEQYPKHLDIDGYIIEDDAPIATVGLGTYYRDLERHASVLESCGIYDFTILDSERATQALELCLDFLERFTDAQDAIVHLSPSAEDSLSLFATCGFQSIGTSGDGSAQILALSLRER